MTKIRKLVNSRVKGFFRKVLCCLVRADSRFSKFWLTGITWIDKEFERYSLVTLETLSSSKDSCIYELFSECSVAAYTPRELGVKSSIVLVDCPALSVYSLSKQVVHVNSSCILDYERAAMRGDIQPTSPDCRYEAVFLKSHGQACGLVEVGDRVEKVKNGVFLGGNGSFNYYHYLVELIPKLEALGRLGEACKGFPLLVSEKVREIDTFTQIIKEYAPNYSLKFLREDQCYEVESLIVISSGAYLPFNLSKSVRFKTADFIIRPESVSFLRRELESCVKLDQTSKKRRLFLSRRGLRRDYNQEEVLEKLTTLGFESIFPEDYTFREQVRLFSEAECIVGPTGAAWTNIIFAGKGCKALCWMAEEYGEFAAFSTLAGIAGVDLKYHFYRANVDSIGQLYLKDYSLDVDSLSANILEMLGGE